MKLNKKALSMLGLVCLLSVTAQAQKFLDKPLEKWGKDEAVKLVNDSPWAQTYQSTESLAAASREQISREQADTARVRQLGSASRNLGATPIVIRLHSALPIRQALVRLRQLNAGYDKLDETKRAEFDKSSQGFLACAICRNFFVVTITKFVDSSGQSVDEGIFQRMTLEQLKGNIWLVNQEGERRELVQFNPPKSAGDMAVFYFARKDDKGNDFITPEVKSFEFVFNNDFLSSGNPYASMLPRRFEFNVPKLVSGGNVVF